MERKDTLDSYTIDASQILPQGGQSTILLVKDEKQKSYVAKLFNYQSAFSNELNALLILGEREDIIKMKYFNGKGIYKCQTMQFFYPCMILEYCQLGSLIDYIESIRLKESTSRFIFRKILEGLNFCHMKGIFHYDIKPDNILIKEKNGKCQVKIADFGLSSTEVIVTKRGSIDYMNPQMHLNQVSTGVQADMFGLGMILFNMIRGVMPFNVASLQDFWYQTLIQNPQQFWALILDREISESVKDLIERMLALSTVLRLYDYEKIKNHEWLKGEESTDIEVLEELKGIQEQINKQTIKDCPQLQIL